MDDSFLKDLMKNLAPLEKAKTKEEVISEIEFYTTCKNLFEEIEERYNKLSSMFLEKKTELRKQALKADNQYTALVASQVHKEVLTFQKNASEDSHKALCDLSRMRTKLKALETVYEMTLVESDNELGSLS